MATNRTASPSSGDNVSTSVSPRQRGDIDTLSAFQGVISNEDAERQTERLIRLYREKSKGGIPDQNSYKICLLHDDRKWHHAAHDVNHWYTSKGLPCHIHSYCDDGWFDEVQRLKASHYLFFGLPPFEKGKKGFLKRTPRSPVESQQEIDFFTLGGGGPTNLKLNNVVVVLPEKISTKKEYRQKISGHYLEHYVKLDGQKTPSVLAASALGIFIAPQPKPMESDKAYWSANPKLVEDFRVSSEVPLGLTIMTREMAEGAPFERIVLINSISSNYRYEFYARVGRYTHIQSINGILLDGLSVEKVTDVFKKLPDHHVQMLIRYIHMGERDGRKNSGGSNEVGHPSGNPSPLSELPNRQSVASSDIPPSTIPSSRNETQIKSSAPAEKSLILPLPLFILGDNYSLCKQLYTALKAEPPPPYSELASRGSTTPTDNGGGDFTSGGVRGGGGGRVGNGGSHLPPKRSTSMPQGSPSMHVYNRLEHRGSQGSTITSDESADVLTPLIQRPITLNMESENRHVRRRTSSFRGISSSDKFIQRCEMPMNKFEKLPILQDNPETDMTISSPLSPGNTPKPVSTEMLPQHQFILHLPLPELDRFMSHLYFKASGIYLVVIGLEDLIANPVCQYENLFYWINLIHTYVSPDAKRMFVVGLYKRSVIEQKHVIESLKVLNRVLANYRQMVKIPLEEQGYVYLFDLENQEAECQYLCSCILNCTRLFAKSSYYFTREFHDHVFSPFREFQKIASDIGLNHDRALLESKYVMGQRFCMLFDQQQHPIHLPMGYYETLANYSTACISRHCDGCLLIPSVIPELLNLCARLSEYDTQIFDDPDLRGLPLFSIHMLRHGFKLLYPNNSKDFEMVIWWMEHLSIIYSVGKKRVQDERFFVPFLLHYHLSDRPMYEWDEERVQDMFVDAITLYAQFSSNVPMTIHLFHKILAYILQSVLKVGAQADCFINPDSPEVVLPLHDDNSNDDLGLVLVRFLPVQNIIEFKSNVSNRMKFLHVVENKLSKAFLGSKYYNKTIDVNRVVSFRVPADSFSRETTHPHVWDLAELESSMDEKEEHLVATSHLTEPGNRKKTPALRRWADQDPEMKELPIELAHEISQRLSLSEQWVKFVVKLRLMQNDEILLKKQNQQFGDPGAEALQKWKDSSKTLADLSECLRGLHLDNIADKVDSFNSGDEIADPSPYPSSKIREKKLPTELFLELSTALNFNEKWALLGSYLNLLKTSEIEALKLKTQVDKGGHVLSLWTDSHLTYQDLINGLQNQKVGLNVYVPKIEAIIKSHNAQL